VIDSIINYTKVALHHSTCMTFIYAIIFTIALAYLHELGHVQAARFYGLKKVKIRFGRVKEHSKKIPLFYTYFDDDEMASLENTQFRVVAAGGIFVDLVTSCIAFFLLLQGNGLFRVDYWFGFIMAGGIRFVLTPLNLIPISMLKNDGYNLFFPNHRK